MRTRDLKHLAEQSQEEYEIWRQEQIDDGVEEDDILDIFAWVGMEYLTAQEDRNDYLRDEGLL